MQKFFHPPSRHLLSQPFPPRFAIVYAHSTPPTKKWECSHFCDSRNMINHTPPTPIRHVNINIPTPGENVDINIPDPVFQGDFFRLPPPFFSRWGRGSAAPSPDMGQRGLPRPRGCRPPAGAGGAGVGNRVSERDFSRPSHRLRTPGQGGRPKPISRGRPDRGTGALPIRPAVPRDPPPEPPQPRPHRRRHSLPTTTGNALESASWTAQSASCAASSAPPRNMRRMDLYTQKGGFV